jgi:hypothetical protein
MLVRARRLTVSVWLIASLACHAAPATRSPLPSVRDTDPMAQIRRRGVRLGELDPTDPIFPDDWKTFDAFTFRDFEPSRLPPTRTIDLFWWSDYVDGQVSIIVTSHQIYIHTGHDNPNPNVIHWAGASTEQQRSALEVAVTKRGPPACTGFTCSFRPHTPDTRKSTWAEHLRTVAANIAEVLAQLTTTWPSDVPRLTFPDARALDAPRVFLFDGPDVDGWLGHCHRDAAGPLVRDDGTSCPF